MLQTTQCYLHFQLYFLLALYDKVLHVNDRASTTCIIYSLATSVELSLTYFPLLFPSVLLIMFLFTGLPLDAFHFLFENVSYMEHLFATDLPRFHHFEMPLHFFANNHAV